MTKAKPKTIDEYLAGLSDDKRVALERLRKIIQSAAPKAEECISYCLPAFRLDGKTFIWFGAGVNHCAIYGVSETYKDEFKNLDTRGRGTLHFQAADLPPAALVRKLVRARMTKITRKPVKEEHHARKSLYNALQATTISNREISAPASRLSMAAAAVPLFLACELAFD